MSEQGGTKFDQDKSQWHLLPFDALEDVIKILELGQVKYGKFNWKKGFTRSRLVDATFRHLTSYVSGDRIDKESGCSHLAHAVCNLLFMISLEKTNKLEEDI